jgi:hypothetical protein
MAEKNYEEMQALFVSKPVDQSKTLGELYEELQKKYIHLVHSYEGRQVFSKIALTFFKDNTRLGEKALKRINALELSQNAENIKQTVEFLDNPKYKNFLEWIESTPDLILQHCREGFKDLLMLYELNSIKKLPLLTALEAFKLLYMPDSKAPARKANKASPNPPPIK